MKLTTRARFGWMIIVVVACASATHHASAQAVGCGRDTDCKGDRICDAGKCVSPERSTPPPVVASEAVAAPTAEPRPQLIPTATVAPARLEPRACAVDGECGAGRMCYRGRCVPRAALAAAPTKPPPVPSPQPAKPWGTVDAFAYLAYHAPDVDLGAGSFGLGGVVGLGFRVANAVALQLVGAGDAYFEGGGRVAVGGGLKSDTFAGGAGRIAGLAAFQVAGGDPTFQMRADLLFPIGNTLDFGLGFGLLALGSDNYVYSFAIGFGL